MSWKNRRNTIIIADKLLLPIGFKKDLRDKQVYYRYKIEKTCKIKGIPEFYPINKIKLSSDEEDILREYNLREFCLTDFSDIKPISNTCKKYFEIILCISFFITEKYKDKDSMWKNGFLLPPSSNKENKEEWKVLQKESSNIHLSFNFSEYSDTFKDNKITFEAIGKLSKYIKDFEDNIHFLLDKSIILQEKYDRKIMENRMETYNKRVKEVNQLIKAIEILKKNKK